MASIKVEDPDGNYLPTHGLGTVIKLNRRSGSLIIGHTFEFIPTPDPVGKYLSEENSAELREQNLELVNENFKLRNKIKELEDLINKDKLKDAAKSAVKKAGARAVKTGLRKALFGI